MNRSLIVIFLALTLLPTDALPLPKNLMSFTNIDGGGEIEGLLENSTATSLIIPMDPYLAGAVDASYSLLAFSGSWSNGCLTNVSFRNTTPTHGPHTGYYFGNNTSSRGCEGMLRISPVAESSFDVGALDLASGVSVSFSFKCDANTTALIYGIMDDVVNNVTLRTVSAQEVVSTVRSGLLNESHQKTPLPYNLFSSIWTVEGGSIALVSGPAGDAVSVAKFEGFNELFDNNWHHIVLVVSESGGGAGASVRIYVDGQTSYKEQRYSICLAGGFAAAVSNNDVGGAGAVGPPLVFYEGGVMVLGDPEANIALFNLQFHRVGLTAAAIVQLAGVPWMRQSLAVTPSIGYSVAALMLICSVFVVVSAIRQSAQQLAGSTATLEGDDFQELEVNGQKFKELAAGTFGRLMSRDPKTFAVNLNILKQCSFMIPPLIEVQQVLSLLFRGFTFPLKFQVPMEWVTFMFSLRLSLPQLNVTIPPYVPMVILMVLALGCLFVGVYFGNRDNCNFNDSLKIFRVFDQCCVRLTALIVEKAIQREERNRTKQDSTSEERKENIYDFKSIAESISRNGYVVDAATLAQLRPEISLPVARVIVRQLGERPRSATEAVVRYFLVQMDKKIAPQQAIEATMALAKAAVGTSVASVLQPLGLHLAPKEVRALLALLNEMGHHPLGEPKNRHDESAAEEVPASTITTAPLLGGQGLDDFLDTLLLRTNDPFFCEELQPVASEPSIEDTISTGTVITKELQTTIHQFTPLSLWEAQETIEPFMVFEATFTDSSGTERIVAHDTLEEQCMCREFHRSINYLSQFGVSWPLPKVKILGSGENGTRLLRNVALLLTTKTSTSLFKKGPSEFTCTATASEEVVHQYQVRIRWVARLQCPVHHCRLIAADDYHYETQDEQGKAVYECIMQRSPAHQIQLPADPCRSDSLLACRHEHCTYCVCKTCLDSISQPFTPHITSAFTKWHIFQSNPAAFLAFISFVGIQFVYLPATEESLMVLGCNPSVQCQYPGCYSNMSSQFLTAAIVAAGIVTFLSIGVPLYWGLSLFRRRRSVQRVVHTNAQWDDLISRDETILSKLYNKYERNYMVLEPFLLVFRTVALVAAVAFTEPESAAQLIIVSCVIAVSTLFLTVTAPFVDPWLDILTKADLAHNTLQLALLSIHQSLSYEDPSTSAMVAPMYVTSGLFFIVYALIFHRTVLSAFFESRKMVTAGDLKRQERMWLSFSDLPQRAPKLRELLQQKVKLFGKQHFQVALTMSHIAESELEPKLQEEWRLKAGGALLLALQHEFELRGRAIESVCDHSSFRGSRHWTWEPTAVDSLSRAARCTPKIKDEVAAVLLKFVRWSAEPPDGGGSCSCGSFAPSNALTLYAKLHLPLISQELSNISVPFCDVSELEIRGCALTNADFSHSKMYRTVLRDCNVTHLNLYDAAVGCAEEGTALVRPSTSSLEFSTPLTGEGRIIVSPRSDIFAVMGLGTLVPILSVYSGQLVGELVPHRRTCCGAAFSPSEDMFVCGDESAVLYFWDLKNFSLLYSIEREKDRFSVEAVEFSPSGAMVAAMYDAKYVLLVNCTDKKFQIMSRVATRQMPFFLPNGLHGMKWTKSTVEMVDLATGASLADPMLFSKASSVSAISFDGKTAIGIDETLLAFVDIPTGAVKREVKLPFTADSFARSPDGLHIAIMNENRIIIVLVETGAIISQKAFAMKEPISIESYEYDRTGRFLLVSSCTKKICTITRFPLFTATSTVTSIGHIESINEIGAIDEDRYASVSCDLTLKIWDRKTGAEIASVETFGCDIQSFRIVPDKAGGSPKELIVTTESSRGLKVLDLNTLTWGRRIGGDFKKDVSAFSISPDGTKLTAVHYHSGNDRETGRVFDVQKGDPLGWLMLPVVEPPVKVPKVKKRKDDSDDSDDSDDEPDLYHYADHVVYIGNTIVVSAHDWGELRVWNGTTGEHLGLLHTYPGGEACASCPIAASKNSSQAFLYVASPKGSIDIFSNLVAFPIVREPVQSIRSIKDVKHLECSADGSRLLVQHSKTSIALYETVSFSQVWELKASSVQLGSTAEESLGTGYALAPSGTHLAYYQSRDDSLHFWSTSSRHPAAAATTEKSSRELFSALCNKKGEWLVKFGESPPKLLIGISAPMTELVAMRDYVSSTRMPFFFHNCELEQSEPLPLFAAHLGIAESSPGEGEAPTGKIISLSKAAPPAPDTPDLSDDEAEVKKKRENACLERSDIKQANGAAAALQSHAPPQQPSSASAVDIDSLNLDIENLDLLIENLGLDL